MVLRGNWPGFIWESGFVFVMELDLIAQVRYGLGGTFINYECRFHTSGGKDANIVIGENCDIAPQCMFMCTSHKIGDVSRRAGDQSFGNIVIEDGSWIGTRATILPNVTIGRGSVIGAASLVNRNMPESCIAVGVPARVIKRIDKS